MAITTLRIFPPIGIARLGDSAEFFVGPERPRDSTMPAGGYRDASCRIRRQAARFRVYAYDENDALVLDANGAPREITSADGTIAWTVDLANTKASWNRFNGLTPGPLRNAGVADRASLEISPGPRTLNGANQTAAFDSGRFLGKQVPLGEVRTDAQGRCLVLAGFGESASVPPGQPLTSYANNEGWHDDTADGPVHASVTIGAQVFQATPAWVICAPTKFAPALESMTSLYDTLEQKAVDLGLLPMPGLPSLTRDIWPVLRRTVELGAVSDVVIGSHGGFDLANPQNIVQAARQGIVARLRNPNAPNASPSASMPILLGDDAGPASMTLTRLQYRALDAWTRLPGADYLDDWAGTPVAPALITPDGLTRAALEPCVGGAFFPGIEAGWRVRDTLAYSAPFRLDPAGLRAGDVTKQMAVPWQADFMACRKELHNNPNAPPSQQTYLWWPAQRPDDVLVQGSATLRAWTDGFANTYQAMVDRWQQLGFVVRDANNQFVETERAIVCRGLVIVLGKPVFGAEEVATALAAANPALYANALQVIAEGFLPAELGITAANPTPGQLLAWAPAVAFHRADGNAIADMQAVPTALLLQNPALPPNQTQRFTFDYRVEFTSLAAFSVGGQPVEAPAIEARASKTAQTPSGNVPFAALAHLSLFQQPNPYLVDGATTWLSTDLRVFKVTEGEQPFGGQFGVIGNTPQAALAFIDAAVSFFNGAPAAAHPFDTISTDPNVARLELSRSVNGQRVFNFAIAKVRYRAQVLQAGNVRVFFRLFTTAATGIDYDEAGTYRRSNSQAPVALLGVQAGKVVTMPCFGRARIDSATQSLAAQQDSLNVRTLAPAAPGVESIGYFGCWLDFNQTEPRFPTNVAAGQENGPWASGRLSIQELIRGQHQCLVAELWFDANPIDAGASAAASESLAQRNLVISESDNPGALATHTVQHTFELKATQPRPSRAAQLGHWNAARRANANLAAAAVASADWFEPGPDELMIRWGSLPRSARMTIYLPDLQADQLLALAATRMDQPRLTRLDEHTIECGSADVSYLPLPEGRLRNSPGLLTIELPEGVKRAQRFDATVHQVSGWPRTVVGSFQLHIPVGDKRELLAGEVRKLSVLRHIARAIPADDPWRAVFTRYLDQIAARVDGFGGDAASVAPSPDGDGRDAVAERCMRNAALAVGLLALAALLFGLTAMFWLAPFVGLASAWAFMQWSTGCRPGACALTGGLAIGLGIGAAAIALTIQFGLATSAALAWLTACVVLAALLWLWGWWRGCLKRHPQR